MGKRCFCCCEYVVAHDDTCCAILGTQRFREMQEEERQQLDQSKLGALDRRLRSRSSAAAAAAAAKNEVSAVTITSSSCDEDEDDGGGADECEVQHRAANSQKSANCIVEASRSSSIMTGTIPESGEVADCSSTEDCSSTDDSEGEAIGHNFSDLESALEVEDDLEATGHGISDLNMAEPADEEACEDNTVMLSLERSDLENTMESTDKEEEVDIETSAGHVMPGLRTVKCIETAQPSSRSLCGKVRLGNDDEISKEETIARGSLLNLSDQERNEGFMSIMNTVLRVVALNVLPDVIAMTPRSFEWSVDQKVQDSYVFHLVILFYQLIHILAISETCHTALKRKTISVTRTTLAVAVFGSLVVQMLVELCILYMLGPIPFRLVSTAWVPFLTVPGILYASIADRMAYNKQFKLLGLFLFYILMEMVLLGCWAVALAHTQQAFAQIALTGVVSLIRSMCKIKFVASVATQLNERENIMLMLVVDFVSVPVVQSVFPYIDNMLSFFTLIVSECPLLIYKAISGADRLSVWFSNAVWPWIADALRPFGLKVDMEARQEKREVANRLGGGIRGFTMGTVTAPIREVSLVRRSQRAIDMEEGMPDETSSIGRLMYHVLDAVGSVGYTAVNRFHSWVLIELCVHFTDVSFLRGAFLPEDWKKVRGFQPTALVVTLGVFGFMQCILGRQRMSILRILNYILREHFWLLLWWSAVGLSYQVIVMDKRFDVDFSLEFDTDNITRADN